MRRWLRPVMRRQPTNNEAAESEPGRVSPAGLASLRLRIDLRYDGSAFHGWAKQPGLTTVQQTVEEALWRALSLSTPPTLTVAGRTDAGVHARGQVGHVDVPAANWTAAAAGSAVHRLGRILPPAVRVAAISPAPEGFDARFSAVWRRYSYRVCDDPANADPLRRHDTLWYRDRLDLDRMNAAAVACLGEHDFAAFCRPRQGATTIRELLRLDWDRAEPGVAVACAVVRRRRQQAAGLAEARPGHPPPRPSGPRRRATPAVPGRGRLPRPGRDGQPGCLDAPGQEPARRRWQLTPTAGTRLRAYRPPSGC